MPIIATVDHDRREVHAVAMGPISYEDVERHLRFERHWGGLAYPEILDVRGAGINLTPAEIRQIVALVHDMAREGRFGRTAVIVSSEYAFGVARMVEMLIEDICELKPFYDEQEARIWLAR